MTGTPSTIFRQLYRISRPVDTLTGLPQEVPAALVALTNRMPLPAGSVYATAATPEPSTCMDNEQRCTPRYGIVSNT